MNIVLWRKGFSIGFIFFIAQAFNALGQENSFKVQWGREFDAPRNSSVGDIIGSDETGFYVLKNSWRGFFGNEVHTLERYDNSLNPQGSIELDLTEKGQKTYLEFLLHLNNQLLMFTSFPDQATKKNALFVQTINKQNLLPDPKKIRLTEIDYEGRSKRNSGSFSFVVSSDYSKVLVFYNLPYDSRGPEKFGFMVFDENVDLIWEKEITLPYRDELFDVESFKVDNQGNVYVLGVLYKESRRTKRNGLPNYEFKILAYTDKGQSNEEYAASLPDKFLTDMAIGIRSNGDIVCAGFYSTVNTLSIRGTFYVLIDAKTREIKTKSVKEFDIGFITQNMTAREVDRVKRKEEKGQDQELYEYDLNKLIVRSDGGVLLVGEQYFVQRRTYTTYMNRMPTTQTITYYYYNDIILVNVNNLGEIDWSVKIPKRQMSVDDGGYYSSYAMTINKDKIYFIYNDNPQNLNYTGVGRVSSMNTNNHMLMLASVNSKGETTRKTIGGGAGNVIIVPKVCEQISYGEMILFGQRRKKQQFGKIYFE